MSCVHVITSLHVNSFSSLFNTRLQVDTTFFLQHFRNLGVKKRSDGVNVASAMIGLIITAVAMTLPTGPLKLAGYTAVPVRDLVSHFTRAHAR